MSEVNVAKDKVIVFDLCDVLADTAHRDHLRPTGEAAKFSENYYAHALACVGDTPIQDNIDLLNILALTHRILLVTSRSGIAQDETIQWLKDAGVNYDNIVMRGAGDNRPAHQFKSEILAPVADKILCAFDDNPDNVKALRELGITVYQCANRKEAA